MSITTYNPLFTYTATAGVGSYNVSLTQPDVNPPSTVANIVSQYYTDLYEKPDFGYQFSCPTRGCGSHFFTGNIAFIQPNPIYFTNITTANYVFVRQLQGLQVDTLVLASGEVHASDCKIWGTNQTAIQICIADSTATPNALVAGNGPRTFVLITRAGYLY